MEWLRAMREKLRYSARMWRIGAAEPPHSSVLPPGWKLVETESGEFVRVKKRRRRLTVTPPWLEDTAGTVGRFLSQQTGWPLTSRSNYRYYRNDRI